ncbi:hypothetical protein HPB48_005417 [Haemaphysalis longicornis]|uniref:Amino acid transporter transmembrane domain-containing protein n=1 Tax=Haemaphysalis longicornis TaxID=44386 RepID=A0A9J6GIE6_HAELO|nr:hypothetical protein HPB48_005417 [Haemaphysalis longicornis]
MEVNGDVDRRDERTISDVFLRLSNVAQSSNGTSFGRSDGDKESEVESAVPGPTARRGNGGVHHIALGARANYVSSPSPSILSAPRKSLCRIGMAERSGHGTENLWKVLRGAGIEVSVYVCLSVLLPVMVLYNFIRSLRMLALASTAANLLQTTGMVLIFYNLLQDMPAISERPLHLGWSRLPIYFGTVIYAFEGIGIVLPLENEMKTPADFGGANGVLNTGMIIVVCLYTAIGFFGFLKYGSDVKGSITLNFPPTPLNEVIRVIFAISIFLSYALQLYVPVQIIWPAVVKRFGLDQGKHSARTVLFLEYLLRSLLVLMTCEYQTLFFRGVC